MTEIREAGPALCGCGCGEAMRLVRGRYAKFRSGHFSRTPAHRERMAAVDPSRTKHVGEENGNWRGGRRIDPQGYVVIRYNGKQTREHRVVASQMLGRDLKPGEVVHHKNGLRSDNRPENLEILSSQSEHMRHHMTSDEARKRGAAGHRFPCRAALQALSQTPPQEGGQTE